MKTENHSLNEIIIDIIGEDRLKELAKDYGNYRFSFSGLMISLRRRIALRLITTHSLEEVAKEIGRSERHTERILSS